MTDFAVFYTKIRLNLAYFAEQRDGDTARDVKIKINKLTLLNILYIIIYISVWTKTFIILVKFSKYVY
jgi:hypothetical protein